MSVNHNVNGAKKQELVRCRRAKALHKDYRLFHAMSPGRDNEYVRPVGSVWIRPKPLTAEAPVIDLVFELRKTCFAVLNGLGLRLRLKWNDLAPIVFSDYCEGADELALWQVRGNEGGVGQHHAAKADRSFGWRECYIHRA